MTNATKITEASFSLRDIMSESPQSRIPTIRAIESIAEKLSDRIKY